MVIAGCAVWSRFSRDDGTGVSTQAMGYSLLAANGFYFIQLIVLALSAFVVHFRRKHRKSTPTEKFGSAAVALLVVPQPTSSQLRDLEAPTDRVAGELN